MRSLKARFGLMAAVCALGALGFAGTASAVTLNDGLGHLIPNGTSSSASLRSGQTVVLAAGFLMNTCSTSTLNATVTDNGSSSMVPTADVTNATFGGPCSPLSATASGFNWPLRYVSGSAPTVQASLGSSTQPVQVQVGSFLFTGTLSGSGFTWTNPGAATNACPSGHAEIKLNNVGTLTSGILSGTVTADYCGPNWFIS